MALKKVLELQVLWEKTLLKRKGGKGLTKTIKQREASGVSFRLSFWLLRHLVLILFQHLKKTGGISGLS